MSLSVEYAKNGKKKLDVLDRKLDLEERKWYAEQRERERQRQFESEQLKRDEVNRRGNQRHENFLALVQQGKTPSEIEMALHLYGNN
ncbi:hypothetical protein PHMEG_00011631 [Phytophthora megakarya]|uniref:Uncharacterized protein n=1 Tax=Phytophthora megakarya TaxID=4795 RepID=A0A225WCU7_9STRA|nr:hypothetical protein PHMEG_00011631 [Phytophthora megakarya]